MKHNEYAYRILLEFDKDVQGMTDTLKDAFVVSGEEYEFIGGNTKNVLYPVENVMFPQPITHKVEVSFDNGSKTDTMLFNDVIILNPLEVS